MKIPPPEAKFRTDDSPVSESQREYKAKAERATGLSAKGFQEAKFRTDEIVFARSVTTKQSSPKNGRDCHENQRFSRNDDAIKSPRHVVTKLAGAKQTSHKDGRDCHTDKSAHNDRQKFSAGLKPSQLCSNDDVNRQLNILATRKSAFTLAEVLLTMTIIGIIAAMTIPVLMTSVSKTETETRLKKAYSTFAQAMQLVEAGERRPLMSYYTGASVANVTKVKTKLKKYLNVTDISSCDSWTYAGTLSDGIIFELDGGALADYYITLWVDINGAAEPNSFGYDRFYFAMFKNSYIKDHPKVKPLDSYWRVYNPDADADEDTLVNACSRNKFYCSALIMYNGWEIPDSYPLDI